MSDIGALALRDQNRESRSARDVMAADVGIGQQHAPNSRRLRLFDIELEDTTRRSAAAWIVRCAKERTPATVAFVNAHCINTMFRDSAYRDIVAACDRVFIDGSGMAIAARMAGLKLLDNVNGTDLFPLICGRAARAGTKLFLLGGQPGAAADSATAMIKAFSSLAIAGTHHGYLDTPERESAAIDEVNRSGADILLVGMGVPIQEKWIARNRDRLNVSVVVAVGGLFDYYSGRSPRAPLALRSTGLEWLWRLALEPRRLAKRYLGGNVQFLARAAWLRLVAPRSLCQPPTGHEAVLSLANQ